MKLTCLIVLMAMVSGAAETRLDGHRVYYEVSGTGSPAIVLVHGWTCDFTFFAPQIAEMSKKHRVLAVDLPGHGKSDKPEVKYDGVLFARAVLAAMDAAEVEKAVLVGHSMGLPVIRTVYAQAPARVLGLVSLDGAVFSGSMEAFAKQMAGEKGVEVRRGMMDHMLLPSTPEVMRRQITDKMLAAPEHVAVSAMANAVSSPLWKEKIDVPTLALQQKRSAEQSVRKYFDAAFSKLDYRELDGVSHFLNMDKPAEVNSAILAWVAGLQ